MLHTLLTCFSVTKRWLLESPAQLRDPAGAAGPYSPQSTPGGRSGRHANGKAKVTTAFVQFPLPTELKAIKTEKLKSFSNALPRLPGGRRSHIHRLVKTWAVYENLEHLGLSVFGSKIFTF